MPGLVLAFLSGFAAVLCSVVSGPPRFVLEESPAERLPAQVLRAFSFGQIQVLTDWSLLRMLADAEVRWVQPGEAASQYYDLKMASELDPLFYEIYSEGPRFLVVVRNDAESALELAKRGLQIQRTGLGEVPASRMSYVWPTRFEIPFVLGYLYLFERPNLDQAAEAYSEAGQAPEAPPYIASLGAHLSDPVGRFQVGLRVLNTFKANAKSDSEKERYQRRIKNLYLIQFLTQMRTEFAAFLQEQAAYRAAVSVPVRLMDDYFRRFLKARRLEAVDPYGGRVYVSEAGQLTSTTPYESEMGLR